MAALHLRTWWVPGFNETTDSWLTLDELKEMMMRDGHELKAIKAYCVCCLAWRETIVINDVRYFLWRDDDPEAKRRRKADAKRETKHEAKSNPSSSSRSEIKPK